MLRHHVLPPRERSRAVMRMWKRKVKSPGAKTTKYLVRESVFCFLVIYIFRLLV